MAVQHVINKFRNPYLICAQCRQFVTGYIAHKGQEDENCIHIGRLVPCNHQHDVISICPCYSRQRQRCECENPQHLLTSNDVRHREGFPELEEVV